MMPMPTIPTRLAITSSRTVCPGQQTAIAHPRQHRQLRSVSHKVCHRAPGTEYPGPERFAKIGRRPIRRRYTVAVRSGSPASDLRKFALLLFGGFFLTHALDDEGACGRVVEPGGQDFLVFGGMVPALERSSVGEFQDNDAFGLRPALDQFGRAGQNEVAAAILFDRGADRIPVGLHCGRVGDLEFDNERGGHGGLPWRSVRGLAAYGRRAPEPRDRVIGLYASYFPVE